MGILNNKKPKVHRIISRDYIRKLASLLAKREKITVVPANHWATNLKTKTLYYDENALRKFNETHVLGFMLHEIGHLKNTSEVNTSTEIFKKHPSVSKTYINGIEDMRIDSIMSRKYSGSMAVIEAMHEQAGSYALEALRSYQASQVDVKTQLSRALMDLKNGAYDTPEHSVAEAKAEDMENFLKTTDVEMMLFAASTVIYGNLDVFTEAKVLECIKKEQRDAVHEIINLIDQSGLEFADSTQKVQDYFEEKIFPVIEPFLPPEESKTSQDKHGNSGQSGQGKQDLNQMNQDSKKKPPKQSSEDENNSGEVEPEYDDNGNEIRQPKLAQAGNDGLAKDTSRASVVQKALPEQNPDTEALVMNLGVGHDDGGSDRSNYAKAQADVKTYISNLSARMNRILRDNSFERYGGRNRSGRLRKSGLYRFMTNDTRLFQRKTAIVNKSYAFSILIDASGSMQGRQWNEALKATALLTDTCKKLNIPIEIIAFSNKHVVAKPFHQPINATLFNKAVAPVLFGGTRLTPAFKQGLLSLNARKETQKFVIILTDGELDSEDQKEIPKMLDKNKHLKFYGIGIGVDLKRYFKNSIKVNDASQIPVEFANILKANIKRK